MDIWAYNETHQPQQLKKIDVLPEHGFIWLDFPPDEIDEALKEIKKLTGTTLHERHVQDCVNTQHPNFFDSMENYDLFIFQDINLTNEKIQQIKTIPVVFIVFDRLLATVNNNDATLALIKNRFQETSRRYPNQPEILMLTILNAITDNFLSLRTPLLKQYNYWQQRLLRKSKRFDDWLSFLGFKRNINQLEMICDEQQDVLDQWRESITSNEPNENLLVRLNDLINHILRVLSFTKKIRNELDTLVELHYSIISSRTSEVVKVLTVISAIFMPLTLITGFFGMNFIHMPLIHDVFGVYAIFAGMVILVLILLAIFRYKKWL